MGRISYIIRCIAQMDCKNLFKTVGQVHEKCGKNRLWLLMDIVQSGFRYGAGYKDYDLFAFYEKTAAQRATFVTRGVSNSITKKLNDPGYYHFFDEKNEFYENFQEYLHRQWLYLGNCTDTQLEAFWENHTEAIIKPTGTSGGDGVEKLKMADFPTVGALKDYMHKAGTDLIEEVVVQHPDIERLAPGAVNTVRVLTIQAEGEAHILFAGLRMGNSDRPVDNICAGGMFTPIDKETGIIPNDAWDTQGRVYTHHPKSGEQIRGFQLPFWPELLAMCKEAAGKIPQMGYLGWDVAITEDGPLLIEGNNIPSHDLLPQAPLYTPDKIGFLPEFQKYIKDL